MPTKMRLAATAAALLAAGFLGAAALSPLHAAGEGGGGGGGGGAGGGGAGGGGAGGGGAGGGGAGGGGSAGGSGGSGAGSSGSSAGRGGGGGGGGSMPIMPCPRGQVPTISGGCTQAESGVVPDEIFADYAYVLAKEERFQEALDMLNLMQDPQTPKALNYRGYATRKLGRLDEGIGYYRQAVALDPNYALVREYLGEAYIKKGRRDLAKEQLKEVERICGTECEAYVDLAAALAGESVY